MKDQQHPRALELLREMDFLRRTWKLAIPKTGINKSEFFTLYTLLCPSDEPRTWGADCPKEPAPMTLSTLSKAMKQSMPAVSQRITKLEELGYVRREPDQRDRRTVWIHLTSAGIELLQATGAEMLGKLERVLHRLDTQDGVNAQLLIQAFHCLALAVQEEFSQGKP